MALCHSPLRHTSESCQFHMEQKRTVPTDPVQIANLKLWGQIMIILSHNVLDDFVYRINYPAPSLKLILSFLNETN